MRESYFVNTLFWHPAILYPSLCLSYFPTAVCVFAPRHLLHLHPLPPLSTSHLLDLIEFFPEEEMFPPNESVEILHSDKHDPIFRLIKERASLFLAFSSHLSVAVGRSFLSLLSLSSFFFRSMIFGYALSAFPVKRHTTCAVHSRERRVFKKAIERIEFLTSRIASSIYLISISYSCQIYIFAI